jgi:hypothetical protein
MASIQELSERAQETAFHNWLSCDAYGWHGENRDTLDNFTEAYRLRNVRFEYGGRGSYASATVTDDYNWQEEPTGVRLATWIYNNFAWDLYSPKTYYKQGKPRKSRVQVEESCPTGYCLDYDIRQPLRDFLRSPKNGVTFEELIQDCLDAWVSACESDMEASTTFEAFLETCEANEYSFNPCGCMN